MCAPDPPPPPDYTGAAVAQGAANKETAIASSRLNNPNVVGPYGTQTFTEGANPDDRPTVTQVLSPDQQTILDQQNNVRGLLGGLGEQGATALQGVVGRNLDLSGAPADPGDSSATRDKVVNAMMGRVDEDTANTRGQANSDLIAAGIRPGTKAYDDRMHLIDRGYNDARNQAILSSGTEAQRDFGMDSERRRTGISEILAQRQTPLNEVSALMSGSQVSNPFATPGVSQGTNIAPPPLYNATQQAGAYGTDIYNSQVGRSNSMMSGLFGLGSSALGAYGLAALSDRRLKSNVVRIGTHPLGIGIYSYEIFGKRDVGVMADEVLAVKPSVVIRHASGYLAVDYGAL